MNKLLLIFLVSTSLSNVSKGTGYPFKIEKVLTAAGKNRPELEKFVAYCKRSADPLKLKAAYFLIGNMDIHYSMDYYWEDGKGKPIPFSEFDYPDLNAAVDAFAKLKEKYPAIRPHPFKTEDITSIKAAFLIDNMNAAFKSWRSSEYSHIPFTDFCEYILPYRTSVEPLQAWRTVYAQQFSVFNEAYGNHDLNYSLSYLAKNLHSWFTNTFSWGKSKEPLPRLSARQLLFRKKGACEDIADLVTFTTRAYGIPSALNVVPYWATSTNSHFFNTVFDPQMKPVSFDAINSKPVNYTLQREPSKVLQVTYAKQPGALANTQPINNIPPGFLRTVNYIDVTRNFWETVSVRCQLFKEAEKAKYAFACVFNGANWRPTWWGKINNHESVFTAMPKGVVYLPAVYVNNRIIPAGYPIVPSGKKLTKLSQQDERSRC